MIQGLCPSSRMQPIWEIGFVRRSDRMGCDVACQQDFRLP